MTIGEFFVVLGIKGNGLGTLKEIGSKIADLPVDAAAAIAGMAGISFELSKMAEEAMHTAVAFQTFSNETGLSWQELQKWQLVAEQANVSAQTVASSVETLERNLADIRLGRGNIAPFQMLGIDPRGNAFQVIDQLRDKIRGLNPATATNMISQMGLSPEMMNVLRLSDRQFTEFANHVHGINERQQQDFLKSQRALVQLGESFRYVMFGIIAHFTEAIEHAEQFRTVLKGLGVVALGLAAYFFPITAAIGALILVLDDLAVYFSGGRSLTGRGLDGLKKMFSELEKGLTTGSWFQRLIHFEELISKIAMAGEKISDFATGNVVGMLGTLIPAALPIVRAEASKIFNRETTVNMQVHGAGSLDAPGWSNVAGMIKRSVEEAHLQLNN